MLTWHFCIAQILNIIQRYIYKQLGSTKTKQASHILQYITHLHQHTWSIHSSSEVQNVHTKYLQIFSRVLEFTLTEFCAKSAKINVPRLFPLLQYWLRSNVRKTLSKVNQLCKEASHELLFLTYGRTFHQWEHYLLSGLWSPCCWQPDFSQLVVCMIWTWAASLTPCLMIKKLSLWII